MMQSFKQSLFVIMFAGLSISSVYAATEKATEKKKWLANLIMQFKVNRNLIQQHQQHQLPLAKQELENLRAKQRQILKKVAKAGVVTAFLIAIGAITAVAAKKYGEGKAPAGPQPTFEAMHKGYAPPRQPAPGPAERAAQEVRETPRAPMPTIGNGEEQEKSWKAEQEALQKKGLFDIGDIGQ